MKSLRLDMTVIMSRITTQYYATCAVAFQTIVHMSYNNWEITFQKVLPRKIIGEFQVGPDQLNDFTI